MNYFKQLSYRATESSHITQLPTWAMYFVKLGQWVARSHINGSKTVATLSVPTRAFCSSLIAAGAISQLALVSEATKPPTSDNFQRLLALPSGTSLIRKDGSNKTNKRMKKVDDVNWNGMHYIRVQTLGKGKLIELISANTCEGIMVDSSEDTDLPINQPKSKIDDGYYFRSALVDADTFYGNDSIECLFIGTKQTLEAELLSKQFIVPNIEPITLKNPVKETAPSKGAIHGTLQDIIRAKSLEPKNSGYKSDIAPARDKPTVAKNKSKLVLFDGALAFMKWKYLFNHASWVVVLDRTERNYFQGLLEVNDSYLNRVQDLDCKLELQCPHGIDVMTYSGDSS